MAADKVKLKNLDEELKFSGEFKINRATIYNLLEEEGYSVCEENLKQVIAGLRGSLQTELDFELNSLVRQVLASGRGNELKEIKQG